MKEKPWKEVVYGKCWVSSQNIGKLAIGGWALHTYSIGPHETMTNESVLDKYLVPIEIS